MTTAHFDEKDENIVYANTAEAALAFWLKANEGETVYLDANLCGCAEWTVGERRCSCGNRRVYADFDPDAALTNKYFIYPTCD